MKQHEKTNKNAFSHIINIPPQLAQAVSSGRFCLLQEQELDGYLFYITAKTEQALYRICSKGMDSGFTWESFVLFLQSSHILRTLCESVIEQTISAFIRDDYFDFSAGDIVNPDAAFFVKNDKPVIVQIYPDQDGRSLVEAFMLRAQVNHYIYRKNLKLCCTWQQYITALSENEKMRKTVAMAFRDAIFRLDFHQTWISHDIEELWKNYIKMFQNPVDEF